MENEPSAKRLKTEDTSSETKQKNDGASSRATTTIKPRPNPKTFVTWNVNGWVTRCNWNRPQLDEFLQQTQYPDVICLQEVRLKRCDAHPVEVQHVMRTIFRDYNTSLFSLAADKKYAGTCVLIHNRLQFAANQNNTAYTFQSAIDMLLRRYNNLTRKQVGLPPAKVVVAADSSTLNTKKQTSMKSFFAVKKPAANADTSNNDKPQSNNKNLAHLPHHPEGRFQFIHFPAMDLINTYVPNNGTKAESFQRRRQWDVEMQAFLCQRQQILNYVAKNGSNDDETASRPLLWCGDLNCALDHRDGTHWSQNPHDGSIYEWWTDESKCYASAAANKLDPARASEDRGMPSFTPAERRRLQEMMNRADLVDVWRARYPQGTNAPLRSDDDDDDDDGQHTTRDYASPWDHPDWTWRGHLSKEDSTFPNKYQGKGQRLDYFLLSPSSLCPSAVESCEILGYGERREGLFGGSDHCATMLVLKEFPNSPQS